jgi:hypothetical protein
MEVEKIEKPKTDILVKNESIIIKKYYNLLKF